MFGFVYRRSNEDLESVVTDRDYDREEERYYEAPGYRQEAAMRMAA